MGLLDTLKGVKDGMNRNVRDTTIGLTVLGKKKAEAFSLVGPQFEVVSILNERGAMNLGELSKETGYALPKVREVANSLLRSGIVKKA